MAAVKTASVLGIVDRAEAAHLVVLLAGGGDDFDAVTHFPSHKAAPDRGCD